MLDTPVRGNLPVCQSPGEVMNTLTIDEKMLLVQRMRERADRSRPHNSGTVDKSKTQERKEQAFSAYAGQTDEQSEGSGAERGTFRLRLIACVLVFSAFFGLYKMNVHIRGHQVGEITQLLEENKLPKGTHNSLKTMSEQMLEEFGAVETD